MWRKQAAREKAEDQHDFTREQEAAILEHTCVGQVAPRGNTTYEALSLKVGATFMLIYCHSCLTVALDQQQITSLVFKCWNVQDTLSVRYNTVFIIDLKQFTTFRMSLPVFGMENRNIIQKLIFVFTLVFSFFVCREKCEN